MGKEGIAQVARTDSARPRAKKRRIQQQASDLPLLAGPRTMPASLMGMKAVSKYHPGTLTERRASSFRLGGWVADGPCFPSAQCNGLPQQQALSWRNISAPRHAKEKKLGSWRVDHPTSRGGPRLVPPLTRAKRTLASSFLRSSFPLWSAGRSAHTCSPLGRHVSGWQRRSEIRFGAA